MEDSFKFVKNADITGTFFRKELEERLFDKIKKHFSDNPDYTPEEDEKGYTYENFVFENKNKIILTVYTRWGIPRIGGGSKLLKQDIEEFENWIDQFEGE
jgi:hypothetical protein